MSKHHNTYHLTGMFKKWVVAVKSKNKTVNNEKINVTRKNRNKK